MLQTTCVITLYSQLQNNKRSVDPITSLKLKSSEHLNIIRLKYALLFYHVLTLVVSSCDC